MLSSIQDSGGIYTGSCDYKQPLFCVSALCLQYVLPRDNICVGRLCNLKKQSLISDNTRYCYQIQVVSIYLCCCSRQPQAVLPMNSRHALSSYLEATHRRSVLHHCWVLVRALFCVVMADLSFCVHLFTCWAKQWELAIAKLLVREQ